MGEIEGALCHPLLNACEVPHTFGVRDAPKQPGLLRPRQVHGAQVAVLSPEGLLQPEEADAVLSDVPGMAVAVATADCVPILACCESGEVVAAIHAGWRGLAAGVVEAGIAALRARSPAGAQLVAAIGPHIGVCCYEVDMPVLAPLRKRFGAALEPALRPTRSGHAKIDLGLLVSEALGRAGVDPSLRGKVPRSCTFCHPQRFHSYRRDGPRAGRLLHVLAARRVDHEMEK